MRVLIAVAILTATLVTTAPAQIANGDSVFRAYGFKEAPSATNSTSSGDSTVSELLAVMGLKASFLAVKSSIIANRIQSDPRWGPYKDVLQQWADEVFDWNKFETSFVKLLTQRLTRDEIVQIIKFHQSPLGKKWLGFKHALQQDMTGQLNAADQRYRAELRRRVQRRAADLKQPVPS